MEGIGMAVPAEYMYFPLNEKAGSQNAVDQSATPKLSLLDYAYSDPTFGRRRVPSGDFGAPGKLFNETCYFNERGDSKSVLRIGETSSNIPALRTIKPECTISMWIRPISFAIPTGGVIEQGSRIFLLTWLNGSNEYWSSIVLYPDPNRVIGRFVQGNLTWTDVVFYPLSSIEDRWLHITMSWKETGSGYFYINGQKINTVPFIPSTTADATTMGMTFIASVGPLGGVFDQYQGSLQDIRFWDTQLSDSVVLEHFNEVNFSNTLTSTRTIPKRELNSMRDIVASTLPFRATIQQDDIVQWETLHTDVPCSLELTGTRQELNSDNVYQTIQNWVVTIPGNYSLPNPKAIGSVRFLINNLELQSYNYQQTPDDIQTVIECRKV
jgi:hypothetical protein